MQIGLSRRATILKYNGDGTVDIALDNCDDLKYDKLVQKISIPLGYSGPSGEFIGGYPESGTPIIVAYGQGEWFFQGYVTPDDVYSNTNIGFSGTTGNLMGDLIPGRLLLQTKDASNRMYLDPHDGISIGGPNDELNIDVIQSIITHNFEQNYRFTSAVSAVEGVVKRDLYENSMKEFAGSSLDGLNYEESLREVGMDPGSVVSVITSNKAARNLPLTESRAIVYETQNFQSNLSFQTDADEVQKYKSGFKTPAVSTYNKQDSRATAFSLSLHYPNELMEEVKGTGVDSIGNVIDINRNKLSIGTDDCSFNSSGDNSKVFNKIRNAHRKALAYHFEINTRKSNKDETYYTLKTGNFDNMSRDRSSLFMDIDKEGQFKVNIPASSETGNVPLPARYATASVLAFDLDKIKNPNQLLQPSDRESLVKELSDKLEGYDSTQDIYLESFNVKSTYLVDDADLVGIALEDDAGETAPYDRQTNQPLRLNTVYHNILEACYNFQTRRLESDENGMLYPYIEELGLNQKTDKDPKLLQIDNLVSPTIKVGGTNANAGGRSGYITTDGFISCSIGANTVDRQSLWLDTAGGNIMMLGRDINGVSLGASLDGDLLMEIGGSTVTGNNDNRFKTQNNAFRPGTFDIRIATNAGLATIRVDNEGVTIYHPGRAEFACGQNMILRSNSDILFDCENVRFYTANPDTQRTVKRNGMSEI